MSATSKFSTLSVAELKSLLDIDTINVYVNEQTGAKSFRIMRDDEPIYFRVQRDFDGKKPAVFITSDYNPDGSPNWLMGALINTKPLNHSLDCSL